MGGMPLFDWERQYPNHPGHKAEETSRDAAEAMAEHLPRLQDLALRRIVDCGQRGQTPDEVAEHLEATPGAIRPRCSELKRLGFIEVKMTLCGKTHKPIKARRVNEDTGKEANVLIATEAGKNHVKSWS